MSKAGGFQGRLPRHPNAIFRREREFGRGELKKAPVEVERGLAAGIDMG